MPTPRKLLPFSSTRAGRAIRSGLLAVVLPLCLALTIRSAEYAIGPDDVLEVRFWQDEKLNAAVKVGVDGKITLDVIGQISAAGKTTDELQSDIIREISRLRKDISQVVVRVTAFNYNYVFVSGQARTPGKRSFEAIPDLWTIINEAGGANEFGDLSRVTIIRGGDEAGKVEVVNVSDALATHQLDKLPKVRRMDTIEIPRTPGQVPSGDLARSTSDKPVIYVVGAVTKPGPVAYEDNLDVVELLALAGGPAQNADLKRARIITKEGAYTQSMKVDLTRQFANSSPGRYLIRREDTMVIPEKGAGLFGLTLSNASIVVGVVTSVVLLVNQIDQNNRTTTR